MTALTILLEPWAGHRRGATVTISTPLAERLEALGVCRIVTTRDCSVTHPPPEDAVEESRERTGEPMKQGRRRRRGT